MSVNKIIVELTPAQASTVASALLNRADEYADSGGFVACDECEELEQIFTDAIRKAGFSFPATRIEIREQSAKDA